MIEFIKKFMMESGKQISSIVNLQKWLNSFNINENDDTINSLTDQSVKNKREEKYNRSIQKIEQKSHNS